MTQPLLLKSIMLCAAVFVASSCDKDVTPNEETPLNMEITTVRNLPPGESADEATYYSLETGMQIPSSDSATNKWDIAFRGTAILTNSGNGGPAAGGAFVYIGLFNDLKTIPSDSTFRTENVPTSYAVPFGSNRGWYVYDGLNNLVTPIPGRVLVIRTATGKFAKVEILNYYKGGVTPAASAPDNVKIRDQRYYTFRYSYQSNGTKSF